ncbi:UvrD-helicase domain-containing protein [Pseudoteredinibacter isoporae]|uniref:DNA 3'-5' helicase n=1 Tax=Pseudoteredinibacter isoporae TaxID=570281 RepID=A0A7X0JUC7_9GAMM|nr:UvrD-helicase domain-containing protein [Pseudoteredinibacter isoporae]MBB6521590.1 ATP-dependent exoDNAse (exonuclease V) beta subunit [Pseudoteredinibacter isoporae]NHO87144.1 UvrD-helicase domain-containing protein [Pseudoteredinibacter isoporae]NIB22968.1 UvrD-helicase domain-containing protein [Pseudoteredinibacter isoporae]
MEVQDYQAREQAILPGGSFAVAAPAGSGKTGLLTQRVLTLLALCEHPEEVLSITFTRKAAAEMQHRIHQAIVQASGTEQTPENPHDALTWKLAKNVLEQDSKNNWQLLQSPNRIRVQTIDGFCRSLARQLPLASGLGALPDTLDNPNQAYEQAVQSVFSRIEQDDTLYYHWRHALRHLDNQLPQLQELMVALLAKRDQWLHTLLPLYFDAKAVAENEQAPTDPSRADSYLPFNTQALKTWIEECLERIANSIAYEASELSTLADYAAHNLAQEGKSDLEQWHGRSGLPELDAEELPAWQQLSHLLLSQTGWRKQFNKNIGFISPKDKAEKQIADEKKKAFKTLISQLSEREGLEEDLQLLRLLPQLDSCRSLEPMMLSLSYLMVVIAAELKLVFRRLGASDFIEVSQAALQALGSDEQPTDIALQLDYQIRHILVDEFQDTAQPQLQLLEKLTAGWEAGDGRSLFIVGDGMQSCYGFRDANVGIFLQARRQGIGSVPLEALDLSVNFRSQTGVVEWVNRVFREAFPAKDDIGRGAVRYSDSVAFKDNLPGQACQSHILAYKDNEDKDRAREQQAEHIAEAIANLRQDAPEDSIAILVRNRPHLTAVLQALEKRNLKWQATDIDPLASRMAIEDLINLTRCLLYPSDRLAWLSVLRSPLLGFNLQELWPLCNWSEDTPEEERLSDGFKRPLIFSTLLKSHFLNALKPSSQKRLQWFMDHFLAAQENRGRKPLRQWIEGFWLSVGGPACLLEEADIDNAKTYFELLESEGWHIKEWQLFRSKVDTLFARPATDSDPKLQVMTIHKSKGLEFDHVFIPELDRRPRSNENALFLWQQRINDSGHSDLLMAPLASREFNSQLDEKALAAQNGLYQLLREEEKLKTEYEATRLLYVACTRAIKKLHLYAALPIDEKALASAEENGPLSNLPLKTPSSSSLLAKIWPSISEELNVYPLQEDNGARADERPDVQQRHPSEDFNLQLDERWQSPEFPESQLLASYRGREFADEDNLPDSYNVEQLFYRHLGTVLHRCLQQIGEDGIITWTEERRQAARPFWKVQLQQLGLWPNACEQACQLIDKALALTLDDEQGRWLLNNQHQDSRFEWRLWDTQSNREYIIDRCFISEGKRWLIDYKSSLPSPGQSEEDFFAEEQTSYHEQLSQYQRLLKGLGDEPVQRALYFPLMQTLKLID